MAAAHHQLGRVAAEENDTAQALNDYAVLLEIFVEYNDKHHLGIVA
jgi:hypothetical protein